VCSIRIFAKNIGHPYYEPTIVVHDIDSKSMPTGIVNFILDLVALITQDEVWGMYTAR